MDRSVLKLIRMWLQAPVVEEEQVPAYTRRKKHPGRYPLADHLPVNEIIIEPGRIPLV